VRRTGGNPEAILQELKAALSKYQAAY
jgi:hypothetical protein